MDIQEQDQFGQLSNSYDERVAKLDERKKAKEALELYFKKIGAI